MSLRDFKMWWIRNPYHCMINMTFSKNVKNSTQNWNVTSNSANKFKSNSKQKKCNFALFPDQKI